MEEESHIKLEKPVSPEAYANAQKKLIEICWNYISHFQDEIDALKPNKNGYKFISKRSGDNEFDSWFNTNFAYIKNQLGMGKEFPFNKQITGDQVLAELQTILRQLYDPVERQTEMNELEFKPHID